jgi:uncharacterized repeat protein (TIGR01451 family)
VASPEGQSNQANEQQFDQQQPNKQQNRAGSQGQTQSPNGGSQNSVREEQVSEEEGSQSANQGQQRQGRRTGSGNQGSNDADSQADGQQRETQRDSTQANQHQLSQTQRNQSQQREGQRSRSQQSQFAAQWRIDELHPGDVATIRVTAASDSGGQQPICLAIARFTPQLCVPLTVVNPQLEFVKTGPEVVSACERFEYAYYFKNSGTGNIRPFMVEERLPEGLLTATGDRSIRFQVDGLESGEVRKFVAEITPVAEGEFSSRARANFEDDEPTRSSLVTTRVVSPKPAVSIEAPSAEQIGSRINYTVRVTNEGEVVAPDARLLLQYPADLRFVEVGNVESASQSAASSASSGSQGQQARAAQQQRWRDTRQEFDIEQGSWPLGDLQPGETVRIRLAVTAPRQHDEVPLRAIAQFWCGQDRQDQATTAVAHARTRIVALPALAIAVVDKQDPVRVGEEVSYEVILTNEGNDADQNVQTTVELPNALEFVRASGDTNVQSEGRQVSFEPIERIEPGETYRWNIVARPTSGGSTHVTASVSSDNLSTPAKVSEPTTLFSQSARRQAQESTTR